MYHTHGISSDEFKKVFSEFLIGEDGKSFLSDHFQNMIVMFDSNENYYYITKYVDNKVYGYYHGINKRLWYRINGTVSDLIDETYCKSSVLHIILMKDIEDELEDIINKLEFEFSDITINELANRFDYIIADKGLFYE